MSVFTVSQPETLASAPDPSFSVPSVVPVASVGNATALAVTFPSAAWEMLVM